MKEPISVIYGETLILNMRDHRALMVSPADTVQHLSDTRLTPQRRMIRRLQSSQEPSILNGADPASAIFNCGRNCAEAAPKLSAQLRPTVGDGDRPRCLGREGGVCLPPCAAAAELSVRQRRRVASPQMQEGHLANRQWRGAVQHKFDTPPT